MFMICSLFGESKLLENQASGARTAFGSTTSGGFASTGAMEDRAMSRSRTTTERIANPAPGQILMTEFLEPLGISQNALARAIRVPPRRINEIVLGRRAVTADTDLRLARFFGLSDGFWLGLQADYELMERRRQIASELARIKPRAG
jgi:addiction module HigA family antidote